MAPRPAAAAASPAEPDGAPAAGAGAGPAGPSSASAPGPPPALGKSGKKICCSCPDTRRPRDECVVLHGPDPDGPCGPLIAAHRACLRSEGFDA